MQLENSLIAIDIIKRSLTISINKIKIKGQQQGEFVRIVSSEYVSWFVYKVIYCFI
jgi:hypothetical protein